jgi:aspartyl-tRNA(Asn)/glutamyl-tRNA(Gln) amidotransferase subunit C
MLMFVCYNHDTASMKLSHEEVRRIARLTRLGLSEEEVESLSLELSNILENFEVLKQLDTSDVPPATHTIPLQNVLKKDDVVESYSQAEILANAPREEEKCFRVQAILE